MVKMIAMENGAPGKCTGLEHMVDGSQQSSAGGLFKSAKRYLVDTSAGWLFYTPVMAASEYFIAGMDGGEIGEARLAGALVQAAVMRPYGRFRDYWKSTWNVTPESSRMKKFLVDTTATLLFQTPVYAGILYASGASLREIAVALPTGLAVSAASGRPYGCVIDRWRKVWEKDE